ncbi:uncharacterized DUF497 family protein [Phyllobacterium ifriqiyense]|uniref:Uncharacterized DUF497 family protein n=1 Tax=Phyllobacterium ifriqiyense TaxID=314238 RepID=A0ABU0SFA1_9HYPH|nr:BrnT family toxin [Phyllobacterium ifriqiyense]MDQ0999440.1 uncharacterized DUF497 family protein [Phyllobacterium ifriqiyense]
MIIIWDEPKRLKNLLKHELDFADLDIEFLAEAQVVSANHHRLKATGLFYGQIIAVVFVALGTEAISIISMRLASRLERRIYEHSQ